MKTRRQFVQELGGGFAAAALATASDNRAQAAVVQETAKKIRIGIIGAENSHTVGYGEIFNRDRKFPGCEVVGVWGETDEFAKNAAAKGQIPWIVKDPAEFKGKIDALIVDHRHAKYHLEAAWPFVEAGIATFIDKPFCYHVSVGRKLLAMVRENRTRVTTFMRTKSGRG